MSQKVFSLYTKVNTKWESTLTNLQSCPSYEKNL